jgi:hypothetical protein
MIALYIFGVFAVLAVIEGFFVCSDKVQKLRKRVFKH